MTKQLMAAATAAVTTREATSSGLPGWMRKLLVVLILAGAVYVRSARFWDPWTGGHNAWGGAVYGNIARNFVKYGYVQTALGPVANTGLVNPHEFEFYYHYPPLLLWLISLSFQIFGVHEWSARLVPLLFSVLSMYVVYRFAWAAFGRITALCALLFMAALPVEAYYGAHVDVYGSVAVFFSLLAVEGYRRWMTSSRTADFGMCLAGVVLGCMTAWYTYFLVPLIVGHFLFVAARCNELAHNGAPANPSVCARKDRAARLRIWLLPAAAVLIFVLFLVHRQVLLIGDRGEIYGSLLEKLLIRASYGGEGSSFGPIENVTLHLWNVVRLYTVPLALLTGLWAALFGVGLWRRGVRTDDWCIAMLLGYGFVHTLAFPLFTPGHDYMVAAYAPGVALASGAVTARLAGLIRQPVARTAVAGAVVALLCTVSVLRVQRLYSIDDRHYAQKQRAWGDIVARLSGPRDTVFLPTGEDRVLQYYLDRPVAFGVDTPEKVEASVRGLQGSYLIVCPEVAAKTHRALIEYLQKRYTQRTEQGLTVFLRKSI